MSISESISNLKSKVENIKKVEDNNQNDLSGTYLFISFDLVNSTKFKSQNENWINEFSFFYKFLTDKITNLEINDELIGINLWKKIGDEILFYYPIGNIELLPQLINRIYKILLDLIEEIEDKDKRNLKPNLSAKATAWIAPIGHYKEPEDDKTNNVLLNKNYMIYSDENILNKSVDFLGADIDSGFRIAKYSVPGKLTLCAKLTYILFDIIEKADKSEYKKYKQNIHFINYEKLKGIWNDRHYPIIWYFQSRKNKKLSFEYDDEFKYPIVEHYFKKINSKEYIDVFKLLKQIFNNLNKNNEINEIYDCIDNYNKNNPIDKQKSDINRDFVSEIHVVAVCINKRNNKFLVALRNDKREHNKNKWECGCTKLRFNQKFKEALRIGYKERFNLNLEFFDSEGEALEPIDIFEFKRPSGRIIPGIIFVAKVDCDEDNIFIDKAHYDEVKFMSYEEIKQLPEDKCVGGFHRRIKLAYQKYIEPKLRM